VRARPTRRLATTAAAALLAVTVPAAPVAGAQPADADGQVSGPAPPPLKDRSKPGDDGQPDLAYTPKQNASCVGGLELDRPAGTVPWGQQVLRFDDLHKFATGAGQTVAVIDTGVNEHAFLRGRLTGGGDYVRRGGNGLEDCDGHGTEVAGIIAAKPTDDEIGFTGIAPAAKILSIRQSSDYFEYQPRNQNDRNAREKAGSPITLAKAIVRAADSGATVINMSVDTCRLAAEGLKPEERLLQRALRYAVEDRDVVVVASAGNTPADGCDKQNNADPEHPTYIVSPPWFSDHVISVAAVQADGQVAPFSMHGPWVSVAAPGTDVISLDPGGGERLTTRSASVEGQQGPIQGTSFAAPYVSGLAALIREHFGKIGKPLSAKDVMRRIKATAAHPAGEGGHNSQVGYGMVNPVGALTTSVAGEPGFAPDKKVAAEFDLPPAHDRDWTPERVAVIGAAGGLGLLMLTLFIVHTVRRQRRDRPGST
jgi:membrane-anchored mycosin MYCP